MLKLCQVIQFCGKIRQQDETKSELRFRSSVRDIIATCLTRCDVAFAKSRYAFGQFHSKPPWWKVIKAPAITRVSISPTLSLTQEVSALPADKELREYNMLAGQRSDAAREEAK